MTSFSCGISDSLQVVRLRFKEHIPAFRDVLTAKRRAARKTNSKLASSERSNLEDLLPSDADESDREQDGFKSGKDEATFRLGTVKHRDAERQRVGTKRPWDSEEELDSDGRLQKWDPSDDDISDSHEQQAQREAESEEDAIIDKRERKAGPLKAYRGQNTRGRRLEYASEEDGGFVEDDESSLSINEEKNPLLDDGGSEPEDSEDDEEDEEPPAPDFEGPSSDDGVDGDDEDEEDEEDGGGEDEDDEIE